MDRNFGRRNSNLTLIVALRKESVDRNYTVQIVIIKVDTSLSARRAWIEIIDYIIDYATDAVALRKESVDRNATTLLVYLALIRSLSARRAWIEIPAGCWRDARRAVALRKESVDRNEIRIAAIDGVSSRSPQGERG